jgi:hypothetical protein
LAADTPTGKQINKAVRSLRISVLSTIEERQNPRAGHKAEGDWREYPKQNPLYIPRVVNGTAITRGTALPHQIKPPEGQSKQHTRQHDEERTERLKSRQVADPSTTYPDT